MKLRSQPSPIDIKACREAWRLQELGCNGSPHVQAVMLYAVAKAINRPVATMPCPELVQLWTAFRASVRCGAVSLSDLPLPLLSYGERFALAIGVLFDADRLPTGENFLELIDCATGSGVDRTGFFALAAALRHPTTQAVLPVDVLRFHGVPKASDCSDDELNATVGEVLDHPP